jgi:hypothetical protein
MFDWLLGRLLRRGFRSRRGRLDLKGLDTLARSGPAAWLLAQERARLAYLAAQERYCQTGGWTAFRHMLERLFQLAATNALVQALLNEQALEHRLAEAPPAVPGTRRSA